MSTAIKEPLLLMVTIVMLTILTRLSALNPQAYGDDDDRDGQQAEVDIGLVCVAMAILCGIAAFAAGAPQAGPGSAEKRGFRV